MKGVFRDLFSGFVYFMISFGMAKRKRNGVDQGTMTFRLLYAHVTSPPRGDVSLRSSLFGLGLGWGLGWG
jgi:hypothetical protein